MRISDWSSDVCSSDLIRIERLAAVRAAPVGLRIGKEREARDARGDRFLRAIDEEVDRPARYAGQARDRLLGARAVADEERPDEVRRRQMRFAHHRAAPAGAAGAAQAQVRESGLGHAGCLAGCGGRSEEPPYELPSIMRHTFSV